MTKIKDRYKIIIKGEKYTMTYILRDCVEYNCIYRILHFTDTSIEREDIDQTINEIKKKYINNSTEDWTIDDVLEELSTIYDFTTFDFDGYLEI